MSFWQTSLVGAASAPLTVDTMIDAFKSMEESDERPRLRCVDKKSYKCIYGYTVEGKEPCGECAECRKADILARWFMGEFDE